MHNNLRQALSIFFSQMSKINWEIRPKICHFKSFGSEHRLVKKDYLELVIKEAVSVWRGVWVVVGAQAEGEEPVVVRHEIYLKPGIFIRQNAMVGGVDGWLLGNKN